jgi:hypothetical protein
VTQAAVTLRPTSRQDLDALVEGGRLWAILDACDEPEVPRRARALGPERASCLWEAPRRDDDLAVAPFLVHLDALTLDWLVGELWPKPWGILAVAQSDLRSLRRHFRRFLTVHDPDDRPVYFRFYDPRVLRPFLDASTRKEIAELLGPCQALGIAAPEPGTAVLLLP